MVACVYCGTQANSKDHVIPRFLGGRATVPACRACNSTFGNTFEGAAAQQILAWSVMLFSWGVRVRPMARWCKHAIDVEGFPVDLRVTRNGIEGRLNKPILHRAIEGIEEAYLRTPNEHRDFLAGMRRKHPAAQWQPVTKSVSTNLKGLRARLDLGPEAQQLALKMTIAASSTLARVHRTEIAHAIDLIRSPLPGPTGAIAQYFVRNPRIEEHRTPLAHVVYVEHHEHAVRGLVQLFGAWQLYTELASATAAIGDDAILYTADPVTGAITIVRMPPVNLKPPPEHYTAEEMINGTTQGVNVLVRAALDRGATRTPELLVRGALSSSW
jgi:hypothetical protein